MGVVHAVAGRSGSGKTTFLCALIAELKRRGRTAAVVKHCGAGFDLGGREKDSSRFFRAGAMAVTLAGPRESAFLNAFRSRPPDRELAAAHSEADIVFVEGGRFDPGLSVIEIVPEIPREGPLLKGRRIQVKPEVMRSGKPIFSKKTIGFIADFVESELDQDDKIRKPAGFFDRHDPHVRSVLREATVGIAGAGGLGSNVALHLARAGVGRLIIADFDRIETSNLNRQQYFAGQIGRFKVDALAETLRKIPSGTRVEALKIRITAANAARLFEFADVLVEAFDKAARKQMLIETWMRRFPDRPIVAASGLAGFGDNARIRERRIGLLTVIGDETSEPPAGLSPMAPRVAIVAAMQANRVIEWLMKERNRFQILSK